MYYSIYAAHSNVTSLRETGIHRHIARPEIPPGRDVDGAWISFGDCARYPQALPKQGANDYCEKRISTERSSTGKNILLTFVRDSPTVAYRIQRAREHPGAAKGRRTVKRPTLTKRQKEILDYVRTHIQDKGYAPTLEEIGQHFRLSSMATVHKHLSNLAAKGLVERGWNRSRDMRVVDLEDTDQATIDLPLMGRIAAGAPIEAIAERETISVPRHLVGTTGPGRRTFVLKVKGDSMIDDHIQDGDFVIVREADTAQNGDTVVALVDNDSATLKRFYRESDHVRLQPSSPSMQPIRVTPDQPLRIQGIVVGLMRKY